MWASSWPVSVAVNQGLNSAETEKKKMLKNIETHMKLLIPWRFPQLRQVLFDFQSHIHNCPFY